MRELRVHGVGGPQEERLLGVRSADDVEVVALGNGTRIVRRRHAPRDGVEGYSWGGLNSSSANTAGWILFIPFTLLNTAGWAAPSGTRGRVHSAVAYVLALTGTASYVLWTGFILVDLVGWQWRQRLLELRITRRNEWLGGIVEYAMPIACGLVFVLLVGALFLIMRRRSPEPTAARDPGSWAPNESFSSDFYRHESHERRWRVVHALVAAVSVVGIFGVAVVRHDDTALHLGDLALGAGILQGMLVGTLWLLAATPARVRPVGAAIATLGAVTANAAFAGFALLTTRTLSEFPAVPADEGTVLDGGPLLALTHVFFWSLVAGVVLGLLAAAHLLSQRLDLADLPTATRVDIGADGVSGLSPAMAHDVGRARRFARLAHCAHLPVCAVTIAFLAGGLVYAVVSVISTGSPFARENVFDASNWTQWLGGVILTALPVLTAWALRRAATSAADRRVIGVAWDVALIWPRRYHPLAVPPYAAQTSDDLRARIRADLARDPLLVAAHSQGSALAFIALRSLAEAGERLKEVWLLTYGSHLNGIYAVAFPRHFDQRAFDELRGRLGGWRNYWRLTDPIGAPIQLAASGPYLGELLPGVMGADEVISPDPPRPRTSGRDPASAAAPLERDRPPWLELSIHSHYLAEPDLKAWVQALKRSH